MVNKIDPEGIMIIKQGGFYYNVSGNDAFILNKYLGYKLYGVHCIRTGFPVSAKDIVLKKIDTLSMNYDLLDQQGNVVVSKRFEDNIYEIIDSDYPTIGIESSRGKPRKLKKRSVKEKMEDYIKVLSALGEGIDYETGELIEGMSEGLKLQVFEMLLYFDGKQKARAKLEEKYPRNGKSWTDEEDAELLEEYNQGKSVNELAIAHERSTGAIRSRLVKLNARV